jgi:uncharacterized protein YrrD
MLHKVNDLSGFRVVAADSEIGYVEEFYFDDERWTLRYVVVNTGNWLVERQILVSPFAIRQVDWENHQLHVALTKSQVEKSPDIETHKPVSRQMEAKYADYYGYPYYWGSPLLWGAVSFPLLTSQQSRAALNGSTVEHASTDGAIPNPKDFADDVHLRSTQEVSTYSIAATDGEIGHVEDFIVEEASWAIRYLVIDTHKWWAGKKVMIAPKWIASIDWAQASVHVRLSREGIRQSPAYDGSVLLSRTYEEQLYGHYGQTGYWLD